MTAIVERTDPDTIEGAIEHNVAAFLLALGAAGGGEVRDTAEIGFVLGGSPIDYHNAVFRSRLAEDQADTAIAGVVEAMARHSLPASWHLGPLDRPGDLGARLARHGFVHAADEIGMAVELSDIPPGAPGPAGLAIEAVRDEAGLAAYLATLARGFGEGPREAEWVGSVYRRLGFGEGSPWHHFVGRIDGDSVATATVFLAAGVAGVYFVFTIGEARRRGIAAAMMRHALAAARGSGYHVAVLGASADGAGLYETLGFRPFCRLAIHEWRP